MISSKIIAVAGVTGNTGSAAAQTLIERGAKVRVLVRSADKGEPWKKRGAEVAIVDLADADSIARALRGADGAYLLSPPDMQAEDFIATRTGYIDAIRSGISKSGLSHAVYLSSVAAQHEKGTGAIRTAYLAEQSLGGLDASMTFIRACYFMENWAAVIPSVKSDGVLPSMWSPADRKVPHVATRDIGRVAADALVDGPQGRTRVIELGGPEDLSPNDIAAVLADLLGRDVSVSLVPPEAQVPVFTSIGASLSAAEMFYEMYRGIESGKVGWEGGDTEFVRGNTTAREVFGAMMSRATE